jgi:hypothetical protein
MEIEFNSSRQAASASNQPVKRPSGATSAAETASIASAQNLEQTVRNLPMVRPEQVERARSLIADSKYPPQEMLNRIANLLALHMRD